MAKKSRTPAPPRPVQAPKRRSAPRKPGRTRLWIAVAAGALLVAGAAGAIAFALTRGGDAGAAGSGPCQVRTVPSQGAGHVEELPEEFEPNSFPRATGPHHPQTLVFSDYSDPVPQLNLVHNLEHGAVAVQYGPGVSEQTVERLLEWYRVDPRGLILAPLPNVDQAAPLRNRIALTAWNAELEDDDDPNSEIVRQEGIVAVCTAFDADAFDEFLEDHRAKGPERFPLDQLQPGSP